MHARCLVRALPRRPFSGAASTSLPPSLAAQVDEFNREMEALFCLSVDAREGWSGDVQPAQSLHPVTAATSATPSVERTASSTGPISTSLATPAHGSSKELTHVARIIHSAHASGELSARERRYLRLMLRNEDQQLLRFAVTRRGSDDSSLATDVSDLLDVLDERVSHALLQQYHHNKS
jgi:hypothetical protein